MEFARASTYAQVWSQSYVVVAGDFNSTKELTVNLITSSPSGVPFTRQKLTIETTVVFYYIKALCEGSFTKTLFAWLGEHENALG